MDQRRDRSFRVEMNECGWRTRVCLDLQVLCYIVIDIAFCFSPMKGKFDPWLIRLPFTESCSPASCASSDIGEAQDAADERFWPPWLLQKPPCGFHGYTGRKEERRRPDRVSARRGVWQVRGKCECPSRRPA